jgi:hypothetical protein
LASGFAAPVTREKSQFPAQHDSPSLSPAHDGIQPLSNFRALAALFLWAAYFSPQHHAGANEFGSFAPLLFFSRLTAGAVGFLNLEPVRRARMHGARSSPHTHTPRRSGHRHRCVAYLGDIARVEGVFSVASRAAGEGSHSQNPGGRLGCCKSQKVRAL